MKSEIFHTKLSPYEIHPPPLALYTHAHTHTRTHARTHTHTSTSTSTPHRKQQSTIIPLVIHYGLEKEPGGRGSEEK